jgi:GT2 family glycosyltransferase
MGSSNIKVGVVLPTYAARFYLESALQSLRISEDCSEIELVIVVVDNHEESLDEPYAALANTYLALPSNPGFGAAANAGIVEVFKDKAVQWVFLLNPDATVPNDFFAKLHDQLKSLPKETAHPISPIICFHKHVYRIDLTDFFSTYSSSIQLIDLDDQFVVFDVHGAPITTNSGMLKSIRPDQALTLRENLQIPEFINYRLQQDTENSGAIRVYPLSASQRRVDHIIQNAGSEIYSPFSAGDLNFGWLHSQASLKLAGPRRAWCGAAVVLPRNYINQVGLFDETFFLYFEDTELSYRGLKRELYPVLNSSLLVFHHHSALTSQYSHIRSKAIWQSRQIFAARTTGIFYSLLFLFALFGRCLLLLLFRRTTIRHAKHYLIPEIFNTLVGSLKSFRHTGKKIRISRDD